MGTWTIPFSAGAEELNNASRYLACDGVHQRAVTHSGAGTGAGLGAVHLQWSPPHKYHGIVVITASIVTNYSTYWASVRSHPVSVSLEESRTGLPTPTEKSVMNVTTNTQRDQEKTQDTVRNIVDYYHEFISLENLSTQKSDLATQTENSFVNNKIPVENLYNIVTESITVLNSSLYKERMPRFENQELYEKMEAEYGAWENRATGLPLSWTALITFINLSCIIKGIHHLL